MFESLVPLVIAVPAALFGRRRAERHGELAGAGAAAATGTDGVDAFSAFASVLPADEEGRPVEVDQSTEVDATRPSDVAGGGGAAGDWPAAPSGVSPAPAPVPQPDRPNELWHSFGSDDSSLAQLTPFEERFGVEASTAAAPYLGRSGGSNRPSGTQFRLNRLRPVVVDGAPPVFDDTMTAGTAVAPRAIPAGTLTGRPVGRSRIRPFVAGDVTHREHALGAAARGTVPGIEAGPPLDAEAAVESVEPAGKRNGSDATTVPVLVAADGVVATGSGTVRVAGPDEASVTSGPDGLVVNLLAHWCWAALDEFSNGILIRVGATMLALSGGSTGLVSVDDDGAHLVVVLAGEGVVERDGRTIQLGSGAMAYLPVEGEPQVDVASDEEIRADPLVARNLWLDEH